MININKNILDNVYNSVWVATAILTYREQKIKGNTNLLSFKQVQINKIANIICEKTVQSARISQWCNGDHSNNIYNYLREDGKKRRLSKFGEFNYSKEYPMNSIDEDTEIFEIEKTKDVINYHKLVKWYKKEYSQAKNIQKFENDIDTNINNAHVKETKTENLSEDKVKEIINNYLVLDGWKTQVAWGRIHGIDIDAFKDNKRWIIEVKGCGSRNAMRVNYFLAILGETLQRMNDPNAKYSIALPDMKQYRNLWYKLPRLAKERTGISVLFVNKNKEIEEVK